MMKRETVTVLSQFNFQSGGYMHICQEICEILSRDLNIIILGDGYTGQYHQLPFSIVPSQFPMWLAQIEGILSYERVKTVLVFHDLPKHEKLLEAFEERLSDKKLKYLGVFPVESSPIPPNWAHAINSMDGAFVLSKFGLEECQERSLKNVNLLPVSIDTDFWKPGDKTTVRDKHKLEGHPIILTVADNQERKNLSAGFRTIQLLKETYPDLLWILVTTDREHGWNLKLLRTYHGLEDNMAIIGNLDLISLLEIYQASDVLFLPSLAEGLGMPLLEAAAVGIPTVGTDCTAITENVDYPVPWKMKHIHPYGTSWRYWIDEVRAAEALKEAIECPRFSKRKMGSWEEAATLLLNHI